jgi:hypothetical protein
MLSRHQSAHLQQFHLNHRDFGKISHYSHPTVTDGYRQFRPNRRSNAPP